MKYTIGTDSIYTAQMLMGLAEWLDQDKDDNLGNLAPTLSVLLSEAFSFIGKMKYEDIAEQHEEWEIVLTAAARIARHLNTNLHEDGKPWLKDPA